MKNSIQKGILAAVTVLLLITGQALVVMASETVRLEVTATFVEFTAADPGTCDPNTFLPNPGDQVCIATLGELFAASGDMTGGASVEATFAPFPDGSDSFTDFQTWSGTVNGHGTGAFTLLEYDGVTQADGSYTSQLRSVDGTGTGDFKGITARGSSKGNATTGFNTLTLTFPGHKHH
jgi:Protein of unknown function (DUF3224)